MLVEDARVIRQRRALEVRLCVELPPLRRELGERLGAGVELREPVGALERPHLALERLGIRLRSRPAASYQRTR
jgi:hypothetical protein